MVKGRSDDKYVIFNLRFKRSHLGTEALLTVVKFTLLPIRRSTSTDLAVVHWTTWLPLKEES